MVVAKAAAPFNADRFCPSLQDRFVASQDEETNRWSEIANSLEKGFLVHWQAATVENGRLSSRKEARRTWEQKSRRGR